MKKNLLNNLFLTMLFVLSCSLTAAPGDTVIIDIDSTNGGIIDYGGDFTLITGSEWSIAAFGSQLFSNGGNKGNGYISYQPKFPKSGYYKIYDWNPDDEKGQWVPMGIITGEDSSLVYVDRHLKDGEFHYVQTVFIDTAVHNEFIYFNDNNGGGGTGDYVKVDGMQFVFVDSTMDNGNVADTIIWDAETMHQTNWLDDLAAANNYMNLDKSEMIGSWTYDNPDNTLLYGYYFYSNSDIGEDSIILSGYLPKTGFYIFQMSYWTSASWRASEVPVSIESGLYRGDFVVNQKEGDGFVTIDTVYVFDDDITRVIASNGLSETKMGVDAYRFIYLGNPEDTIAPSIPSSFMAEIIDTDTVDLVWNFSTDNVGVVKYVVWQDGDSIAETSNTELGVGGLDLENNAYTFSVAAYDEAGNRSDSVSIVVSDEQKEYVVVLEEAFPTSSSQGRFPVHLFIKHDGGQFTQAGLVSFYINQWANRSSWIVNHVDASDLRLTENGVKGEIIGMMHDVQVSYNMNFSSDANGIITGNYSGQYDGIETSGGIDGKLRNALDLSQSNNVSLLMKEALPPGGSGEIVTLTFNIDNGIVSDVSMMESEFFGSMYNVPGIMETEFISADGLPATQMGHSGTKEFNVLSHTIIVSADSVVGEVECEIVGEGTTYTYIISGGVTSGHIIGTCAVKDNTGTLLFDGNELGGHIAPVRNAITASAFSPIQSEPTQTGDGFLPPYFKEISQSDFYNRLQNAAFWLAQSDYVGAFHSDFVASRMQHTNNKQYDNGAENSYAGSMSMLMLSRLADDPQIQHEALQSAQRAGYWAQYIGKGSYNVAEPYKGLFYTTVGQALAFLELYLETGDAEWMNNAMRYADGLEELQTLMYDSVAEKTAFLGGEELGGTWTYYNPAGGSYDLGQSDSRSDRSRDWYPIQAGEFLYFLGKLRVEGGVDAYKAVEDEAYNWMKAHYDSVAWLTKNREGLGASYFLMYMLQYADNATDAAIDSMVAYIESNHTIWEHNSSVLSPGVEFTASRMQSEGTINANTTLRMAQAYIDLYEKRGTPEYLDKAKAFIYSVLSRQNDFGYIQHSGIIFTAPDAHESFASRFSEYPSHPYSIYNAETVRLLHACYLKLDVLGEFGGGTSSLEEKIEDAVHVMEMRLYPNPAEGQVFIDAGVNTINGVEVYTLTGELVTSMSQFNSTEVEMSLSNFNKGVYLMKIYTAEGVVETHRLIVK